MTYAPPLGSRFTREKVIMPVEESSDFKEDLGDMVISLDVSYEINEPETGRTQNTVSADAELLSLTFLGAEEMPRETVARFFGSLYVALIEEEMSEILSESATDELQREQYNDKAPVGYATEDED